MLSKTTASHRLAMQNFQVKRLAPHQAVGRPSGGTAAHRAADKTDPEEHHGPRRRLGNGRHRYIIERCPKRGRVERLEGQGRRRAGRRELEVVIFPTHVRRSARPGRVKGEDGRGVARTNPDRLGHGRAVLISGQPEADIVELANDRRKGLLDSALTIAVEIDATITVLRCPVAADVVDAVAGHDPAVDRGGIAASHGGETANRGSAILEAAIDQRRGIGAGRNQRDGGECGNKTAHCSYPFSTKYDARLLKDSLRLDDSKCCVAQKHGFNQLLRSRATAPCARFVSL